MKSLQIEGTAIDVEFYEDDTIERVRELIALKMDSHPDRLFIQIRVTLPDGYYTTPKEWTDLFFRLSRDGATVSEETLRTYVTQVRPGLASTPVRAYTKEEWENVPETDPLRKDGGQEWQIFGAKAQPILPPPFKDVDIPASMTPLLSLQRLFESMYRLPTAEVRVTRLPDPVSESVKRNYFPRLQPGTPTNLNASKDSIEAQQKHLGALLNILPEREQHVSKALTKAKWYIPLNATAFPSTRVALEQIFYGMTLSKDTPLVALFMSQGSAVRAKYYVEDPKTKEPYLKPELAKALYTASTPSRERPTLLLYRGASRSEFQRIAVTSRDITIDIRKDSKSTATLDEMKEEARTWLLTLDALVPSLDSRDLVLDRWQLVDMTLTATYAKEETEFDLLRFPCLQALFGQQGSTFRFLRVDRTDLPRRIVDACQALTREGAVHSAEYLAEELGTTPDEAEALLAEIEDKQINCDSVLQEFPIIAFGGRDATIQFATDPDRILRYVDLLRYVLTPSADIDSQVCPRRPESVPALAAVPQMAPEKEPEEDDDDFFEGIDIGDVPAANAAAPAPAPAPAKPKRSVKVAEAQTKTLNYFNARLQEFDKTSDTPLFKSPYSKECDKNNQVIVLTPADKERIRKLKNGEAYTYDKAGEKEVLPLLDSDAVAICPPYWCMTDQIPLREEQLERDEDGTRHCPVCKGKVRETDTESTKEYPVIKRETKGKFNSEPRFMKKRPGVPCCYPKKETKPVQLGEEKKKKKEEEEPEVTYVLADDMYDVPPKRVARLSPELASRLGLTTSYDTTISNRRLEFGQQDIFRIGVGTPRDHLPTLLGVPATSIKSPKERPDVVRQCSMYQTNREVDPIEDIERRWNDKALDPLDELEYLSFFLNYGIILVSTNTFKVQCGFRVEGILRDEVAPKPKTLVVFTREGKPPTLLGSMQRQRKEEGKKSARETRYFLDLFASPFNTVNSTLLTAHRDACRAGLPRLDDAIRALQQLKYVNETGCCANGILDADGQLQFLIVEKKVILPFVPIPLNMASYKPESYRKLHEIPDTDFPTYEDQTKSLQDLLDQTFFAHDPAKDRRNADGQIVEVETVTGFRIPVAPTPAPPPPLPFPPTEVLQTVRAAKGVDASGKEIAGEEVLLAPKSSQPDRAEIVKSEIDYESELHEFILFSLANDIRGDGSGDGRTDYSALRTAISELCGLSTKECRAKAKTLETQLNQWFKAESYQEKTATTYEFISKVRTPCGQLEDPDKCKASSLCGWVKKDKLCKVQVRSKLVDPKLLLKRIVQTLIENDKQRALVLDNRFSQFFSTVLYLELPHEFFTTL